MCLIFLFILKKICILNIYIIENKIMLQSSSDQVLFTIEIFAVNSIEKKLKTESELSRELSLSERFDSANGKLKDKFTTLAA
jgi:hypothetical protein